MSRRICKGMDCGLLILRGVSAAVIEQVHTTSEEARRNASELSCEGCWCSITRSFTAFRTGMCMLKVHLGR
ncbi:hypothetical protein OH77DRAFT_997084 [Trametes cingulata]|nr:hypothetical protein OH77DRAFT_997084 [Trametes cingulata]